MNAITIENRTQRWNYRGQLLIHAGKSRSWMRSPQFEWRGLRVRRQAHMHARTKVAARHYHGLAPLAADAFLAAANVRERRAQFDPHDVAWLQPGVGQRPDLAVVGAGAVVAIDRHRSDGTAYRGRASQGHSVILALRPERMEPA